MGRRKKTDDQVEIQPVRSITFKYDTEFLDTVEQFCDEYGLRVDLFFRRSVEKQMGWFQYLDTEINRRNFAALENHPSLVPGLATPPDPVPQQKPQS